MKHTRQSLFLTALALVACVVPAHGQNGSDELEQFVDRLASENLLSMSVAVVRDDEVLLAKGYGLADRENGIPNTSSTMFRIASVTKQFTAMAIMILQEDGLLRVGDPVGKYMSDVPDSWKPLTIHQLLTHTSGLMHSWALPAFVQRMAEVRPFREVIRDFYDQPLQFEPGQGYGYSGLGYFLLARLIEDVSGQTYEAFLRARIFDPLGMNDTGADRPGLSADRRARGYGFGDNGYQAAPPVHMPVMTGGGNLYSTVEDMARWDRALRRHELIADSSYEALYTPERENYAYGWFVRTNNGEKVIEHSGGVEGFTAYIARYPDAGVSVIVLSNFWAGVGAVAHAIAREVFESDGAESPIAPTPPTLTSGRWSGSVTPPGGGYAGLAYEVTVEGETVAVAVTGDLGTFEFEDVHLAGDELRFWISPFGEKIDCVLHRRDDGSWVGDCVEQSGRVGTLRMHPPRAEPVSSIAAWCDVSSASPCRLPSHLPDRARGSDLPAPRMR